MKQMESDVAVISAGSAGLAAAVAAAEAGASVIVFEKMGRAGGCGNMASGLFAVESKWQRHMQLPITRETIFQYHMDLARWRADAKLVKAYIDKSADTIDWLEKMGVEFLGVESHGIGNNYTWHVVKPSSAKPMGSGSTMMKVMAERAKELGVQILLKTPVMKIIKEEGRITGVVAEGGNGETIQANAKAVIIATGGFGDNPEWVKKYTGYEVGRDLVMGMTPGLSGDGIRMAWEVGAAETAMIMQTTPFSSFVGFEVEATFLQPNLMVNLLGERFVNEELLKSNNIFVGNAITLQKDKCAFSIIDEDIKNRYVEEGFDFDTGYGISLRGQANRATNLDAEIDKALSKGSKRVVYMADSLEELADQTGININGLRKTVAEYNKASETGRDELFNRQPKYLSPIKKPKFYALKFCLSAFGSLGGIKINHKTEVLNKAHEVIPGLYAAGVDAEAIYGDSYPISLPGHTLGFAINSGRIAGENAAEYVSGGRA